MRVLAGDIGGTKTSLAVFDVGAGTQLEELVAETYPSQRYGSLDEIVQGFVKAREVDCRYACFGIAGPVRDGICEATNLPWRVDALQLAADLGFRAVWLLNDLEANAWGIGALDPADFHVLNAGRPVATGNASVISAGTGLGQAGLFWDGGRYLPFASEGGHADFAPGSDLEIALLRFLQRRHDHVSWERVVSGPGLVNILAFLSEYRRQQAPAEVLAALRNGDGGAAISRGADSGRCPLCSEALDLFVHLYGVEAGNHALKLMSTGGVFIGGGIAPKILERLKQPTFLKAFQAKGRMQPLLRDMPVKVILNDRAALFGPAVYAAAAVVAR